MRKLTTQEFINKANKIHTGYDYSIVDYKNNTTKIKIICPIHGIFEQIPNNHLSGNACPECSNVKKYNTSSFIDKANKIHNYKYDYSSVVYKNITTKIKIICPIHGVFEQIPNYHIQGNACPKCGYLNISNNKKYDTGSFIDKANKIHNHKYDYSSVVYKETFNKIKIICPIHGVFEQTPNAHLQGQGCPKCVSIISKGEIELQDWLKQYINIDTNNRELIKPYELDIIIPKHKLCIEYNGLYWHSEQQGKDNKYHLNKYNLCKDQGYRLISIYDIEWIHKQDIVKSIILNAIGINNRVIHGRKCIIKDVLPKEARIMYDNNHIQGFKGGLHHGLYYKDELVSLMTIDKRGELQRFVNLRYTKIHGSFSKLLKTFNIKDGLYTFADTRYFTGNVYSMNGFKYVNTVIPRFMYTKNGSLYHRRLFQKKNIKRLFDINELDHFDPDLTEYQNMLNNGYDRIWDTGKIKYERL